MNVKYKQMACPLKLKEEEKGILKSTRIMNPSLSYNTRAPIVLSREHRLTRLIVWNIHRLNKHVLTRQALDCYWITTDKSYINALLKECAPCKQYNRRLYSCPEI